MTETETLLRVALKERGIGSLAAFEQRYGAALERLSPGVALALIREPERPRSRDRGAWTPVQRSRYCDGCVLALTALRGRLERGLAIISEHLTAASVERWHRLGERAMRIIGKLARASPEDERAFCDSSLGQWYAATLWPDTRERSDESWKI